MGTRIEISGWVVGQLHWPQYLIGVYFTDHERMKVDPNRIRTQNIKTEKILLSILSDVLGILPVHYLRCFIMVNIV